MQGLDLLGVILILDLLSAIYIVRGHADVDLSFLILATFFVHILLNVLGVILYVAHRLIYVGLVLSPTEWTFDLFEEPLFQTILMKDVGAVENFEALAFFEGTQANAAVISFRSPQAILVFLISSSRDFFSQIVFNILF